MNKSDDELFGIIYRITDQPDWAVSDLHDAILASGCVRRLMAKAWDEGAEFVNEHIEVPYGGELTNTYRSRPYYLEAAAPHMLAAAWQEGYELGCDPTIDAASNPYRSES